jgi:hypothetical protein
MIKDFKFLNTQKQSAVPTGYVPFIHIPSDELRLGQSFCEYPIRYNINHYRRFSFVWEPRDNINKEYRIASWSGSIEDFITHYDNRRISLQSAPCDEYLPGYPRIRRIYVGAHYMINYQNEPRFMNPRFLSNYEFVRIEYKLYEDR